MRRVRQRYQGQLAANFQVREKATEFQEVDGNARSQEQPSSDDSSQMKLSLSYIIRMLLLVRYASLVIGLGYLVWEITEAVKGHEPLPYVLMEIAIISIFLPAVVWIISGWGMKVAKTRTRLYVDLLAVTQKIQHESRERERAEDERQEGRVHEWQGAVLGDAREELVPEAVLEPEVVEPLGLRRDDPAGDVEGRVLFEVCAGDHPSRLQRVAAGETHDRDQRQHGSRTSGQHRAAPESREN